MKGKERKRKKREEKKRKERKRIQAKTRLWLMPVILAAWEAEIWSITV
jgi:hypothetical protein